MEASYRFGTVEVRPAERRVLVAGAPATLGARAFDVLLALIERRDRVVTKDELLALVWPGLVVEENNLQVQVSTLRKVLGNQSIATLPGTNADSARVLVGEITERTVWLQVATYGPIDADVVSLASDLREVGLRALRDKGFLAA